MINKGAHNFPRERGSLVFNDLQESALLSKRKRRRLTCVPREGGSLVFQEKEAHLCSMIDVLVPRGAVNLRSKVSCFPLQLFIVEKDVALSRWGVLIDSVRLSYF